MLALLGTLLSSVLSGGATGLLGVLIQRFFDMKNKTQDIDIIRLNHANALELKKAELQHAAKLIEGQIGVAREQKEAAIGEAMERVRETEAEERARGVESDGRMFEASMQSDRATYLTADAQKGSKWATFMMGMVDWVRGMTRPLLTAYLVIITHSMFNWVRTLASKQEGASLTSAELKEIILLVVSTILYLATVAVVWWFGTRPPKQPSAK